MKTNFDKKIVISNIINVIGFIVFYLSKYLNNNSLLLCSLLLFVFSLLNSTLLLINLFKNKKIEDNYKKKIVNTFLRILFSLFFIIFSILIYAEILNF